MLDSLYTDIGAKIKSWAKWICVVEIISAIIGGIALMTEEEFLYGLLCLIIGPIVAFVSTWLLYAFGQLVEDVHAMREKEGTTKEIMDKREAERKAKRAAEDKAKREAAKQEAEDLARRKAMDKVRCEVDKTGDKTEQLLISDFESAASAFLNRRVSISDIACTLIYVVPKSTGIPKEMHLDMSVGSQEFTSLDLFFDQNRHAYYFKGRQLALDGAWRSEEEIFGFNVSKFKEFNTEVDEDE